MLNEDAMLSRSNINGLWAFSVIWFGQLISLTGSGLTAFTLGVRVYQETGSVTQFALVALVTLLPSIVLSPLAGTLVDRWDRRWAMIFSDMGAGFSTLVIALLLLTDRLEIWHIYFAILANASFRVFQLPAYSAAVTLLVPKELLGRANGMLQLSNALPQLLAPLMGGALMSTIGLHNIILIDGMTFFFALTTLLLVRIPRPPQSAESAAAQGSLLREAAYGWHYIRVRPGLLAMVLYFTMINFSMGVVEVIITPLVLSFASAATLGTVLTAGGSGMLLGSVLLSVWGGPRHRIYGVLGATVLQGLSLIVGGLQASAPLIAGAAFIFLFCFPIIVGSSQALWQSKVMPDVQGRVFAIRSMIGWSSFPPAYLLAGPLADRVFEPLLAHDGRLSRSVGRIIGTGPGRGMSLLIMGLGVLMILTAIGGYLYPRLRLVEDEIPDAMPDEAIEPVAGVASAST